MVLFRRALHPGVHGAQEVDHGAIVGLLEGIQAPGFAKALKDGLPEVELLALLVFILVVILI